MQKCSDFVSDSPECADQAEAGRAERELPAASRSAAARQEQVYRIKVSF
jgi:hypothetical protein